MLPPLAADMNIAVPVIQFLRAQGVDVVSAREEGWHHSEDKDVLAEAHAMNRFVLTHNSDFRTLAIHRGQPITGIIHLCLGGRPPAAVIADLHDLLKMDVDWTPPLVAVYQSGRLRLRQLAAIVV